METDFTNITQLNSGTSLTVPRAGPRLSKALSASQLTQQKNGDFAFIKRPFLSTSSNYLENLNGGSDKSSENSFGNASSRRSSTDQTWAETCANYGERVTLNVGGKKFETYASTLAKFPESLLGAMFHPRNSHLRKLDSTGEYFFDRSPQVFESILNFYRTGKLRLVPGVSRLMLEDELDYWQLPSECLQEEETIGSKYSYAAMEVTRHKAEPVLTTIRNYIVEFIERAALNGVQSCSIEFRESQQEFYAFLSNFSHRELLLHDLLQEDFEVSFNDMTSVQGHSYILFITIWNRYTRSIGGQSISASLTKILEELRQGVDIKTSKDDHIITMRSVFP
eukprot:TRINITY_DN6082_c0_g1_i1.p1 TRINITY_DN6082_c0_g1~~TRINITY_DN6082_c0_g1_i1.p1  ORF type:complete len:337 (+),score=61.78 TRINITY_DN6082_c0_g1_i1:58-1068(+)